MPKYQLDPPVSVFNLNHVCFIGGSSGFEMFDCFNECKVVFLKYKYLLNTWSGLVIFERMIANICFKVCSQVRYYLLLMQ